MLDKIKNFFKNKNESKAQYIDSRVDEKKYGCLQELSLYAPDGNFVYSVGKKYHLPLNDGVQGETLIMGSNFLINMVWPNIQENEKQFLHGLCEGISIYKDLTHGIVFLCFVFSGKPVIVSVTEEEDDIRNWISLSDNFERISACFFLIEATSKNIVQIRNILLDREYIHALQEILIDYKKPEINTIRQYVLQKDTSDFFYKANFKWIYSRSHDQFLIS